MDRCAFISFRLGQTDGVSIVAETWRQCLEQLGWETYTIAGEGPVDIRIDGLRLDSSVGPDHGELVSALAPADLVVVENLLSIPLNLEASRAVATVLAGRPAILHHHDPPWQRARFAHIRELPPDDAQWIHVTINRFTEQEFIDRGLTATTIYNGFDTSEPPGDRESVRQALEVSDDTVLVLHPVRAIERKNVPAAIALAESIGATYWLPGPAEEDYAPELARVLDRARCPVLRRPVSSLAPETTMADLYAASDLVAFPSTWEGFGNPPIEAAIHRRLAAVGDYPASQELAALGFRWLDPADTDAVAAALQAPQTEWLDHNHRLVEEHLSLEIMKQRVNELLDRAGWRP